MSKILLCTVVLTFALMSAALAQSIYTSQDWEGGQGSWVLSGTAGTTQGSIVVDTVTELLEGGNHAFKTVALTSGAPGQAKFLLPLLGAKTWSLQWDEYNVTGATRDFGVTYSYGGGNESGTLNQVLALGQYNIPYTGAMYHYRVAFSPAAATYNKTGSWDTDGAGPLGPTPVGPLSQSQNWGIADLAVASNTWHTMKIDQHDQGDGKAAIKYWIDGALVAEWATTVIYAPTSIRMGGAVSNGGFSSYYDNIIFTVPEPGSMLALGTGLIGLLGFIRRKRA